MYESGIKFDMDEYRYPLPDFWDWKEINLIPELFFFMVQTVCFSSTL